MQNTMILCALQLLVVATFAGPTIIAAEEYPIDVEIIGGYYDSCPSKRQLDQSRQGILEKVKFLLSGK